MSGFGKAWIMACWVHRALGALWSIHSLCYVCLLMSAAQDCKAHTREQRVMFRGNGESMALPSLATSLQPQRQASRKGVVKDHSGRDATPKCFGQAR